MEGGKRKPSSWNLFVKKVFFEGKATNKNYSFKQALTDASKLKSEGKMDSNKMSSNKSKKMMKGKKNMKGGFDFGALAGKAKSFFDEKGKDMLVTSLENYIKSNNIDTSMTLNNLINSCKDNNVCTILQNGTSLVAPELLNMSVQDALIRLKAQQVTPVTPVTTVTTEGAALGGSHHKKSKRKGKKAKKNTQKRR